MAEIDSFGFVPKKMSQDLSATDHLFGNILAARLLLSRTSPEDVEKNKVVIERMLERAASWYGQVVPREDC